MNKTGYLLAVPRWLPNLSLWRDVPVLTTSPRVVMMHVRDGMAFFLA